MAQWVTLDYAARLSGAHLTTITRQIASGKLRARKEESRRNQGKAITLVDLNSLPEDARRNWREEVQLSQRGLPPAMPQANVLPMPADVEAEDPAAGLSEEKLAWATYRFRIIEPLVTGAWAGMTGRELNGITPRSRTEFVRALAVGTYTKPNGKTETYSESGIYKMLRKFKDGGLTSLANDERSDRGMTRLSPPLQDFILAAYCSGGSSKFPALRSMREVLRLVDHERAKRQLLYDATEPKGERLMDYILGRNDFGYMAEQGRGFADYMREDGGAEPPAFYLLGELSYTTLKRFLDGVAEPFKTLARRGLKAYQDDCERTSTRDYNTIGVMQYVVFDHRRCDLFVATKRHGHWTLVRPWETVAIDMRSRMVLASVMCIVPSALSVASCIRQIITKWGLFETAYLDNGKEFTAQFVDGRGLREPNTWEQRWNAQEFDATRGVLAQLGIRVIHAIPYSARSKPIEPFFRNASYFERTLPGACGSRSVNRPEWLVEWEREFKAWEARGCDGNHPFQMWDQFRDLKDWFYFESYNKRSHSGRAMNDRSPEQVMRDEFVERGRARMVDPRALDLLMQKRKLRTVGNGGTFVLTWGGEDYVYNHPALWAHQGKHLETSYDPYDLGDLNVYEPGAGYICTARCATLRHMGEEAFTEDIKERRRLERDTRKAIEQIQRMAAIPTAHERMQWDRVISASEGDAGPLSLQCAEPTAQLPERYELAARMKDGQAEDVDAPQFSPLSLPAAPQPEPESEITFLGS